MDRDTVVEHAQAHCDALLAGEIDRAVEDFSEQLRSNVGALIAQMPLPLSEASVESVDVGGSGYVAILRLVGETEIVRLQTRWKDRDGRPTIVEASHISEPTTPAAADEGDLE